MHGPAAIVGGGLCGFVAYLTLRRAGIEDVTVFSLDDDPAATFRRRAAAIRQTHMRSESAGHCLPTSFPGLAVRDAWTRGSVRPLVASACDRYHPTVATFLDHVEEQRRASGWAPTRARVECIRPVEGGFELTWPEAPRRRHGTFAHVLVATGHPGLHVPEELRDDPRVVHAYEPHDYAESVCVVGAGLAAATEWRNARAAGARVASVRRREPVRRPLNVPRPYLSRRGLARFHRLDDEVRAEELRELLAPSIPPGREWDPPAAEPRVNGADQVVCATGFLRGIAHDRLLGPLAAEHDLPVVDGRLVLAPDATAPGLTDAGRTLAVAGVAAQWAYPAADTLMGARFVAHAFARRCRTR
jgi:cation diffusion facilitator CzcD-associated flavoprotein CzcO